MVIAGTVDEPDYYSWKLNLHLKQPYEVALQKWVSNVYRDGEAIAPLIAPDGPDTPYNHQNENGYDEPENDFHAVASPIYAVRRGDIIEFTLRMINTYH